MVVDALFVRPDHKLAALRVVSVNIGGEPFAMTKAFPHITAWKAEAVEAVESNELGEGNATVMPLPAPLTLTAAIRME